MRHNVFSGFQYGRMLFSVLGMIMAAPAAVADYGGAAPIMPPGVNNSQTQQTQNIHPPVLTGTVVRISYSEFVFDTAISADSNTNNNANTGAAPETRRITSIINSQTRFVQRTPKDHAQFMKEMSSIANSPSSIGKPGVPPPTAFIENSIDPSTIQIGSQVTVEGTWDVDTLIVSSVTLSPPIGNPK